MNCSVCGVENNENAKFCRKCGAAIRPDESQGNTCPVCQTAQKKNAKFCQGCGYNFSIVGTAAPSTQSPVQPTSGASVSGGVSQTEVVDQVGETKPCPSCGNRLKLNAKFCGKCGFSFVAGKHLESAESPQHISAPPPLFSANSPVEAAASTVIVAGQEGDLSGAMLRPSGLPNVPLPKAKSGKNMTLIGAMVLLLCAAAGGGYWWFGVKVPADQAAQASQGEATSQADIGLASSAPVATAEPQGEPAQPPAIVAPTTVEAKNDPSGATQNQGSATNDVKSGEPARTPAVLAVKKKPTDTTQNQDAAISEAEQERKQTSVKTAVIDKPKPSSPPATAQVAPAAPSMPPLSAPPAQEEKLDSQSEAMLVMGEQMQASRMYSGALDAANQILKKYPGNPRATRLKDKARTEIERHMKEAYKGIIR